MQHRKLFAGIGATVLAGTAAFAGILESEALLAATLTQWLFKSAYEALATPLTYAVVGFLKRREGREVFDRDLRFNPLALSN